MRHGGVPHARAFRMPHIPLSRPASFAAAFGAALVTSTIGFQAAAAAQDNTIQRHAAAARALAKSDPTGVVARAASQCPATEPGPGVSTPPPALARTYSGHFTPVPPTRVFDNLSFLGDEFVGVLVLETDQGLILFDAFSSGVEASRYITGDMRQLGLDPKQIRYVVITHGHWDHFGGAGYLQTRYGARVLMGEPDWDAIETADPWGTELEGQLPPKREIAVTDKPMDLTLGNTTVKLLLTPGHSPGTVSALIPAKDGARTHWLALWGGNVIPRNLEPTDPKQVAGWRNPGVRRMNQSLIKFRDWVAGNGGEGLISTHASEDVTTRFPALRFRRTSDPHPFVLGQDRTQAYFTALDHCMQALTIQAASRK